VFDADCSSVLTEVPKPIGDISDPVRVIAVPGIKRVMLRLPGRYLRFRFFLCRCDFAAKLRFSAYYLRFNTGTKADLEEVALTDRCSVLRGSQQAMFDAGLGVAAVLAQRRIVRAIPLAAAAYVVENRRC